MQNKRNLSRRLNRVVKRERESGREMEYEHEKISLRNVDSGVCSLRNPQTCLSESPLDDVIGLGFSLRNSDDGSSSLESICLGG